MTPIRSRRACAARQSHLMQSATVTPDFGPQEAVGQNQLGPSAASIASSRRRLRRVCALALFPLIALATASCSSNDAAYTIDVSRDIFGIQASIFTPDSALGTLYFEPSLAEQRTTDPARSVGLGPGLVKALPGKRAFLFMSYENTSVIRYDIDDDGTLIEGASAAAPESGGVHLDALGVSDSGKVWLEPYEAFALLELDPETMSFERTVDLSAYERPEFPNGYIGYQSSVVVDNTLYAPIYHRNFRAGTAVPVTELVIFDMDTGDYDVLVDNECPMGRPTVAGDYVYVGTVAFGPSFDLLGLEGFENSCLKRIRIGESRYDPNYFRDLNAEAGRPAGEVVAVSADKAVIRLYDATFGPAEGEVDGEWSFTYAPAWEWAFIDLNEPGEIDIIESLPLSAGRVDTFQVDDDNWAFRWDDQSSLATLLHLTPEGLQEGLTFTGYPDSIERVQ